MTAYAALTPKEARDAGSGDAFRCDEAWRPSARASADLARECALRDARRAGDHNGPCLLAALTHKLLNALSQNTFMAVKAWRGEFLPLQQGLYDAYAPLVICHLRIQRCGDIDDGR